MSDNQTPNSITVSPGYVYVPQNESILKAVVASGIVLTFHDRKRDIGGVCYYTHSLRENRGSSPRFAAPAIVATINMLEKRGAVRSDIECVMYGGSINRESERFSIGHSEKNISIGREILIKSSIRKVVLDTGGSWARKIMFNSQSGEAVVARVNQVRDSDWYPALSMNGRKK